VIRGAEKAIEFYKKAFGAVEIMRMAGFEGKGIGHAEIKIGDSLVYLADEWPGANIVSPAQLGGTTVAIHMYVKDCDAMFNQAVAAGAKVSMPLMNMFWGDRYGKVTDPFGHEWGIATHIEDVPPEEMGKRAEAAMKEMMAGKKC
jgi:PhnB protein